MSTPETPEEVVQRLHTEPLHPLYFIPAGHIRRGHVQSTFGTATVGLDDKTLDLLVKQVKRNRDDAKSWGNQKVEALIIQAMQLLGLHAIWVWNDVKTYWAENCTEEAAANIWEACYGFFDKRLQWEVALEKEYMEMKDFVYRKDILMTNGVQPKGCFARLFTECKASRVKAVNRATDKTHKGKIRLQRTKEEMQAVTNRFKKRKKGTALGAYATLKKNKLYQPEVLLAPKMEERQKKELLGVAKAISGLVTTSTSTATVAERATEKKTGSAMEALDMLVEEKEDSFEDVLQTLNLLDEPAMSPNHQDTIDKMEAKQKQIMLELQNAKREIEKQRQLFLEEQSKKEEELKKKIESLNRAAMKKTKKKTVTAKKTVQNDDSEDSFSCGDEEENEMGEGENELEEEDEEEKDEPGERDELEVEESAVDESNTENEDELPGCTVFDSRKAGKYVQLKVKFVGESSRQWVMLYDMWADYPLEVCQFRMKKKMRGAAWRNPSVDTIDHMVRILSRTPEDGDPTKATYCTLWNNGWKIEEHGYDEVKADGEDLLKEFLEE